MPKGPHGPISQRAPKAPLGPFGSLWVPLDPLGSLGPLGLDAKVAPIRCRVSPRTSYSSPNRHRREHKGCSAGTATQQNRSRKIAHLPGRCCRFPSGSGKRRTLVSPAVRSGACRKKDRWAGGRGTRQDGSASTIDAAARRELERMKPDLGRRSATAAARAPPPRACAAVARNPASILPRRHTG